MPGPEEDSQLLAHDETVTELVHNKEAAQVDLVPGEEEEAAIEATGELSEISAHEPTYDGNDTSEAELKLTEMATQMADAVKDADTGDAYEMVEHTEHNGELEEAQYDHAYESYDMGEVDMSAGEHVEATPGEYAEAGSILATQENGGQMLEGEQGEYAYEGELIDKQADGELMHEGQQIYDGDAGAYDENTGEYSVADPGSSLAALSQVITATAGLDNGVMHESAGATPAPQDDGHKDQADERYALGAELTAQQLHSVSHSPAPAGTPLEYKDGQLGDVQSVTPTKRPLLAMHQAVSSSRNTRLKSKVWHWYDIMDDGFRQCRFCSQKYGPLTATTILNRHYQNRHDQNAPGDGRSHRAQSSHHGAHLLGQTGQAAGSVHYDQSAIAAAAAVAAAAAANGGSTPGQEGQAAGHLFHGQGTLAVANGSSTDELLRSVSEAVHNGGQYEENQILMQESFSSMIGSPLSRINLPGARRTLAAVAQFCGQLDMQKNLQTCISLINGAAQRGAKMVFLPEASDFIPERRDHTAQQAQPLDGPFMKEIQQAAKDNNIWVSIGIHEQQAISGHPYNTNAVVSDEGVLTQVYRKLHLFDVSVKDGPRMAESQTTTRGDQITDPVDTPVGKLGLAICYDMRFPELAQQLRHRHAQVLCYPSAFTEPTGAAHWEVLLRARAIETQTYVVAAAHVGKHNSKRSSYGDAMIVDPWGSVIARCSRNSNEPAIAVGEINLEFLDKCRSDIPVFTHKRPDVFREFAS